MEKLIDAHVLTRFTHPQRYVRARACWVLQEASDASFGNQRILSKVVNGLCERLVDPNEELPVKVEAAIAIQRMLSDQEAKGKLKLCFYAQLFYMLHFCYKVLHFLVPKSCYTKARRLLLLQRIVTTFSSFFSYPINQTAYKKCVARNPTFADKDARGRSNAGRRSNNRAFRRRRHAICNRSGTRFSRFLNQLCGLSFF